MKRHALQNTIDLNKKKMVKSNRQTERKRQREREAHVTAGE
jgi:hypothetical protein